MGVQGELILNYPSNTYCKRTDFHRNYLGNRRLRRTNRYVVYINDLHIEIASPDNIVHLDTSEDNFSHRINLCNLFLRRIVGKRLCSGRLHIGTNHSEKSLYVNKF